MPKKKFLITVLLLLSAFGFYQASAQNKNEDAVVARQKEFFEDVKSKKYEVLDNLLTADYIGTYSQGIIDKAHESKDLRQFNLTEYSMSEIKTAFPNNKTGLISFRLHVEVLVEGKKFTEDDFVHCVWTKHGKKWLLSAQTAVKEVKNGN